jgi:hypothetical protein
MYQNRRAAYLLRDQEATNDVRNGVCLMSVITTLCYKMKVVTILYTQVGYKWKMLEE